MNNVEFVLDHLLSEKEDAIEIDSQDYLSVINEHYRLKELYEESEKKLNVIKKQIFEKMKEVKKDKIKGSNGYDYTIATRKARVVSDVDIAYKTIESYGMKKELFQLFNDEKFISCFPDSKAITETITSEYLVIKKQKKG